MHAFAFARETAKIAFAPNLDLFSVPSKSIIIWSISAWLVASLPTKACAIGPFTASTAFNTPLPKKRDLSPSRNSNASREPVDAPDGATEALRSHLQGELLLLQLGYRESR